MLYPCKSIFLALSGFTLVTAANSQASTPAQPLMAFVDGGQTRFEDLSSEMADLLNSISAPRLTQVQDSNPCSQAPSPQTLASADLKQTHGALLFALSNQGQVIVQGASTVQNPQNKEIPSFVAGEFASFYESTYKQLVRNKSENIVVLEFFDRLPKRRYKWKGQYTYLSRFLLNQAEATKTNNLKLSESKVTQPVVSEYFVKKQFKADPQKCPQTKEQQQNQLAAQETAALNLAQLTNIPLIEIRKRMKIDHTTGDQKNAAWWASK